jgi:uncharacterized protein YheU (UPF0270 family)
MSQRDTPQKETPIEVPYKRLTPDVLRALIEEFVSREGTDYGHRETTIDEKVADVMRQIERGDAKIIYDSESQTVNIVPSL